MAPYCSWPWPANTACFTALEQSSLCVNKCIPESSTFKMFCSNMVATNAVHRLSTASVASTEQWWTGPGCWQCQVGFFRNNRVEVKWSKEARKEQQGAEKTDDDDASTLNDRGTDSKRRESSGGTKVHWFESSREGWRRSSVVKNRWCSC